MANIILACTNCCNSHLDVFLLISKQVHLVSYLISYYKFLKDPQKNALTSECSIYFFKCSKFPSKIKFKFNKSITA